MTDLADRTPTDQPDAQLQVLLHDVSAFIVQSRTAQTKPTTNGVVPAQQSNGKKRKLEEDHEVLLPLDGSIVLGGSTKQAQVTFECKDVSFQVPMRKKLRLQLVENESATDSRAVHVVTANDQRLELGWSASTIDEVFCLPVPDKAQRQHNFVLFANEDAIDAEAQVVFSMNEVAANPDIARFANGSLMEDETYVEATARGLNELLRPFGKKVITPAEDEFASAIQQAHRKGEKAYHVKAFRGSKDGYLFFTSKGIVFGFKKPLAFFPFDKIESISYTSVLQRTFNLVITTSETERFESKEVEFSMLDQADFAGIDEYIKRHGLNDASMAAERRAKAYNVNKERGVKGEANGDANGGGEENGETELQKAEQQMQDEEDEEEEDYDPSGGESEGEGEESDEDEEGAEEVEHEEDVDDE